MKYFTNKNPQIALLIVSCDAYMDVVNHFLNLKEKYMPWWDYPCYLVNNSSPCNRENITVINCGNELNWNGRLRNALNSIPEEYVLYMQEDYLISKPVDKSVFIQAVNYMMNNDIWYYKIDNLPRINKMIDGSDYLSAIPSNKRYGINLLTAIIRKDKYMEILPKKDVSAADVETSFLDKVTDYYEYDIPGCVLDTRKIIDVKYGVRRGKWWPSTVDYFKKNGYIIDTSERGMNSFIKATTMDIQSAIHHVVPTKWLRTGKRVLRALGVQFYSKD